MTNQYSVFASSIVSGILGVAIFVILACGIDIEQDPALFTGTLNVVMIPVMLAASIFHGRYTLKNPRFSVFKYIVSGLIYLVFGTFVFYLVAVVFGASLFGSFEKTFTWACLMSIFTFLPCGCALGPNNYTFFLKSGGMSSIAKWYLGIPAITSVIGSWIGAIPIPLDWDKPWQQWPISCICGGIIGFAMGNIIILFFAPLAPAAPTRKLKTN